MYDYKLDAPSQWNLDKRVPLALILALMLQTSGAVWWASAQSTRTENTERRVQALEGVDTKVWEMMRIMGEALAAIRANQEGARSALDRIERNIDGKK